MRESLKTWLADIESVATAGLKAVYVRPLSICAQSREQLKNPKPSVTDLSLFWYFKRSCETLREERKRSPGSLGPDRKRCANLRPWYLTCPEEI
jgi:hypothetical protein